MTARLFSVPRRKAGMVDLITPIRSDVEGYRLKAASNFDGSFTTLLTAPVYGYVDPEVAGSQHTSYGGENVRIIFKPSKYGLSDTGALWLKLYFIIGGVEQTTAPNAPSAATLLSPIGGLPTTMQGIQGATTVQSSVANSQQIDFPRLVENVHIRNLSTGADLFVAFDAEGPEVQVKPQTQDLQGFMGTVSSIWVRSTSASAPFSMTFTYANPR